MALVCSFYANSGLLTKNKYSLLNGNGEWQAVLLL